MTKSPFQWLLFTLLLSNCFWTTGFCDENAYWIWAGIPANFAPEKSPLYIYQGVISGEGPSFKFLKKGLFAHPIGASKIYLTYRVDGRVIDAANLVNVFQAHAKMWAKHKVVVAGLQLDFDAPSSKLSTYATKLSKIRNLLPKGYLLSATGLGDWATSSDKRDLTLLFESADEIVFQMYQIDKHVPNAQRYVAALEDLGHRYKLGVLFGKEAELDLTALKNLNGIVYFIQRKA